MRVDAVSLLEAAMAPRTLRAYRAWIDRYQAFCREAGLDPYDIPSVGAWLESLAGRHKISTIEQAAAGVKFFFRLSGRDNPMSAEPLRLLLRALRRRLGVAKRQVRPLLPRTLALGRWDAGAKGVRDRALFLVSLAAGLRVSEAVGLNFEDIELTPEGALILIRRSKTDQAGAGRLVAIAYAKNPETCPVRAIQAYIAIRGMAAGPFFQSLHKGKLTGRRLDQRAVRYLVKDYTDKWGLDPQAYSTHSFRAGLATAAAMAGASLDRIAQQTGHRSLEVLRGYIRRASAFQQNIVPDIM